MKAVGHGLNEELMSKTNGNGSSARTTKLKTTKKISTQEKIAMRAYEIYLERGGAPGNPLEDWVRAESELLAKTKKTPKKAVAAAA
jgi:Protein of unknown function (DUF2934)